MSGGSMEDNKITLKTICDVVVSEDKIDSLSIAEKYYYDRNNQNVIKYDAWDDKENKGLPFSLEEYKVIIVEYSSYLYWVPTLFSGEIGNSVDALLTTGLCPGLENVNSWDKDCSDIFIKYVNDRVIMFVPRFYFRLVGNYFNSYPTKAIGYINYLLSLASDCKACIISCGTINTEYNTDSIYTSYVKADWVKIIYRNSIPMHELRSTEGTKHGEVYGNFIYNKSELHLFRDADTKEPRIKYCKPPTVKERVWKDLCKYNGIKSARRMLPDKEIVKICVPNTVADYEEMFWDYISESWVAGKVVTQSEYYTVLESTGCCETDFVYRCAEVINEETTINGIKYKTYEKFIGRMVTYGTVYHINLKDAPYPEYMYDRIMNRYESYYKRYYSSSSSWVTAFNIERLSSHEANIYVEVHDTGD